MPSLSPPLSRDLLIIEAAHRVYSLLSAKLSCLSGASGAILPTYVVQHKASALTPRKACASQQKRLLTRGCKVWRKYSTVDTTRDLAWPFRLLMPCCPTISGPPLWRTVPANVLVLILIFISNPAAGGNKVHVRTMSGSSVKGNLMDGTQSSIGGFHQESKSLGEPQTNMKAFENVSRVCVLRSADYST